MPGFSRQKTRLIALCLGTSALTVLPAAAAVIDYPDGSNNTSPIVLTDNSTQLQVQTGTATQSGVISEAGPSSSQLEKIGAGTLIFTADNTYTGPTYISNGTLQLGNGGTTGSIVGGFAQINNSVLTLNHSGTFNFNQTIDGTGSIIFLGTGTTVFTGNIRSNQAVTLSSGTLQIGSGGAGGFIDGTIVNNSVITVVGTSTFNGMSGAGQLQVNGPGIVNILGDDTRTGNTMVAGGTLRIGGNMIGSLSGDIIDNAIVQFNRSDTVTYAGTISGNGQVQYTGGATLIFTGTNSFTGSLNIFSGTVQISNSGATALAANVINGGALVFNRLGTYTYGGSISSGGHVTFSSNSTAILTGTNTYTGGTTVNGGTLQIGNGGTTGSIVGDVNGFGTLSFNRSDSMTFGGVISGNFFVRQDGNGTTILTGANTYGFGTTVNAGTLQLAGGGKLGSNSASLTVNGGNLDLNNTNQIVGPATGTGGRITLGSGTLTVTGNNGGALASVISGTGGVVVSSGLLRLAGDNTYTGGTVISGGALDIGNGGTTGSVLGNITNNSVLNFSRSDTYTFAGVISGSGQVQQGGSLGTVILTGTNTYTGGTQTGNGLIQIGDGGTTGSVIGNVNAHGRGIAFNRSDAVTFPGIISGDNISQIGSGSLTLTAPNTFSNVASVTQGSLIIAATSSLNSNVRILLSGTGNFISDASLSLRGLEVSGGTTSVAVANGQTLNFNALTLSPSSTVTFGSATKTGTITTNATSPFISSTSSIVVAGGTVRDVTSPSNSSGGGGLSTAALGAAQLTVNAGAVVDFNDHSVRLATSPTLGANLLGAGQVLLGNSASTELRLRAANFAGVISGAGTVTLLANTTPNILSGANTYTGATTINSGATLQLGAGGTSGSVASPITDNGALVFNRSDAVTYSGVISGTGTVAQSGSGTLTFSGSNTYTGGTSVNAGTLNVRGKIGSVSVANGGTLSGSGSVGPTTVASGGTVIPGAFALPGTLSINGNLTLASGANFVDFIAPVVAGQINASGSAAINGNAAITFALGNYAIGQRFTLITATGGLSGTFSSLNTQGLPTSFKARLSYDANDVYLNLDPNALTPLLSNATGNQSNVAKGIDAAVTGGAVPGAGFTTLYGLSGSALNSALDQIAGLIGPNVVNGVGQSTLSFLSLTSEGGDGGGSFAPGSAYGKADAPHRAQLGAGQMRVWGAVYGGHVGLSADAVSGAASLSGSNVGVVGGIDMQVADSLLLGATLGWGSQDFRSGNGTGDSDDVSIGLYGRHESGPIYISAAMAYGWHHIKTLRTVTVSGTDVLQGIQDATDFGGRIEAGWHMSLDDAYGLTPYAAFMGDSLESPTYAETAISGASTFALSYAGQTTGLGRTELGAKIGRDYILEDGTLAANLQAAWAHQTDDVPLAQTTFLGLAGSTFTVAGVHPARDGALLGGSLEMHQRSGLFFGVTGEAQLADRTTIVEGMGTLGWRW